MISFRERLARTRRRLLSYSALRSRRQLWRRAFRCVALEEIIDSSLPQFLQPSASVYERETRAHADTAKVLTMDEARRIASNIASYRHC